MKIYSLFNLMILLFLITGCTSDLRDNSDTDVNLQNSSKSVQNVSYTYKAVNNDNVLEVTAIKNNGEIKNIFYYYHSELREDYFTLEYTINPSEPRWKYNEQAKVLSFAHELQGKYLTEENLVKLNFILDNTISSLESDLDDNQLDSQIFSSIFQLKSAVNANLRSIDSNSSSLLGTISPTFLIGKTNFMFQEDIVYNTAFLKSSLDEIQQIPSFTAGDDGLVALIDSTSKSTITFDEIYELYIPKVEFLNHIADNETFHHSDCDIHECSIGCGTDWGCCGSYSGCCYFSSRLCYTHDVQCSFCTPSWYCFSGCEPDGGVNDTVKYYPIFEKES